MIATFGMQSRESSISRLGEQTMVDEDPAKTALDQLMRSMVKPEPQALYHQLSRLRDEMPPLNSEDPSTSKWIGSVLAVVEAADHCLIELTTLRACVDALNRRGLSVGTTAMITQAID